MGNPFDPMNIILLVFAVVAFIRLRSALGKRTGNEDPLNNKSNFKFNNFKKPKQTKQSDAISLNSKDEILNYLSVSDKSFTQQSFIEGSKKAYEMIVQNYAMGNLSSIKDFISVDVYDGFAEAIELRNKLKQKLFNDVIEFDSVEIKDATLLKDMVQIQVVFETKMISYGMNSDEELIEGNKDSPQVIKDTWIFQKSIRSKDPGWELISTNADD